MSAPALSLDTDQIGEHNAWLETQTAEQRVAWALKHGPAEAAILDTLDGLFARYAGEREGGEGFGDFLHRSGVVALPSYSTHRQIAPDLYA